MLRKKERRIVALPYEIVIYMQWIALLQYHTKGGNYRKQTQHLFPHTFRIKLVQTSQLISISDIEPTLNC